MKDSRETMTKVIERLLGPEGSLPCAWRVIYTLLHDNIFPYLIYTLIKIDKNMENIRMYCTIIGRHGEYQNQCLAQRTVDGYGIFFLQTLPLKV